jgi:hypothetical protein
VLPIFALSLALAAGGETTVLVSSLQPRNPDSTGLASLVESFLAQELDKQDGVDVLRVEDTPAFEDYAARVYMDGCPAGEIVGCTYVIGDRGHARYAVTGTVQALASGARVEIEILDISGARELIRFESELGEGSDDAFAAGVAKVLVAAINGEIGEEDDIRDDGAAKPEPMSNDAVAAQLEQLTKELGGVKAVISRSDRKIVRSTYSLDDLAKRMEGEGTKPWERLGMSPGEYLRYKNSGKNLFEWRERAMGRAGQLLLRPSVGFGSGPYDGTYYGRFAYDVVGGHLQVVDAYAAQAVQTGSGAVIAANVAYGLTSAIDVGATFGVALGTWTTDISQETVGQPISPAEPESTVQTTLVFGPRVNVTLLPVRPIRPSFGGGVVVMRGRTRVDPENVDESLSTFAPAVLVAGEIYVGGEARISKTVDFFLHVPVQVRLAGDPFSDNRVGTTEVVDVTVPPVAGVVSAGVNVGLQIRLFGRKPKESTRYDEMDEPDEGER